MPNVTDGRQFRQLNAFRTDLTHAARGLLSLSFVVNQLTAAAILHPRVSDGLDLALGGALAWAIFTTSGGPATRARSDGPGGGQAELAQRGWRA